MSDIEIEESQHKQARALRHELCAACESSNFAQTVAVLTRCHVGTRRDVLGAGPTDADGQSPLFM